MRLKINPRTSGNIAKALIWSSALFIMLILVAIIIFILIKGLPIINWQFLTSIPHNMGRSGGISSTIIGTVLITVVAVVIAAPFGIGTAFYLAEYTRENIVTRIIRFSA